jgi:hypothetical protein
MMPLEVLAKEILEERLLGRMRRIPSACGKLGKTSHSHDDKNEKPFYPNSTQYAQCVT